MIPLRRALGASRVREIFEASPVLGQGNPAIARHPMTRAECRRIRAEARVTTARSAICGAPGMVPLFDPSAGETEEDAVVCIGHDVSARVEWGTRGTGDFAEGMDCYTASRTVLLTP